jgi:hypothetical protein
VPAHPSRRHDGGEWHDVGWVLDLSLTATTAPPVLITAHGSRLAGWEGSGGRVFC